MNLRVLSAFTAIISEERTEKATQSKCSLLPIRESGNSNNLKKRQLYKTLVRMTSDQLTMKETKILGLYSELGSSRAHKNKLFPFKDS